MKYLKLFENFSSYRNKDLVVVDIQPEYETGFDFSIFDFTAFLNENHELFNSITILYNGADTLGMVSENDYAWWLIENGLEEDVLSSLDFYDKGYAFFRYCIDSDIDDDITANLIKYMIDKDVRESRDLDEEFWNELISYYKSIDVDMSDVRELLEHSDDMIYIPDLVDELKNIRGDILLTGGHVEECLREVVLALKAMGSDYEILDEFTY